MQCVHAVGFDKAGEVGRAADAADSRNLVVGDLQFDESFLEGSEDAEVANDYEMFAYLTQIKRVRLKVIPLVTVTFSLGGRTNDPATDFWKAEDLVSFDSTITTS